MGAERIGHLGERLAEMLPDQVLVGDVVGDLAQPVHVVGERDQPGLDLVRGEGAKGMAHHGGARDLAEGADMRQARRAIAGLEDHLVLGAAGEARDDLARFLERPGIALLRERPQVGSSRGHHIGHRVLRARTSAPARGRSSRGPAGQERNDRTETKDMTARPDATRNASGRLQNGLIGKYRSHRSVNRPLSQMR